MPITTKKQFAKYLEHAEIYLDVLKKTETLPQIRYPDIKDFGSCSKDIEEMVLKIRINRKNNFRKSNTKHLEKEIQWCEKNITNLKKSKKDLTFGLICYDKIHSLDWGYLKLNEFAKYLNNRIDMFNQNNCEKAENDLDRKI
jgi:hypothetical protein